MLEKILAKLVSRVLRKHFHDVSSQLVGVHKLKIGHCLNLFFASIE